MFGLLAFEFALFFSLPLIVLAASSSTGDAPPVSGRVQVPGTEMFYLNEKEKEGREKKKKKKKANFLKLAIFLTCTAAIHPGFSVPNFMYIP